MQTISYTKARRHLGKLMDQVNNDGSLILITRREGEPVVMMSLAEYNALEETAYLLRSPANAERLIRSINGLRVSRAPAQQLSDAE